MRNSRRSRSLQRVDILYISWIGKFNKNIIRDLQVRTEGIPVHELVP